MEKTLNCKDCKKEFKTISHGKFQRKYCDTCSIERKMAYENIADIKIEDCE